MKENTSGSQIIKAPWTPEQVERIEYWQNNGSLFHALTCGGNRTDANHLDGEGVLVVTAEGLKCPYCDYTQDWVPEPVVRLNLKLAVEDFYKAFPKYKAEDGARKD